MNIFPLATFALASLITVSTAAEPKTDPVPGLFREAFDIYGSKEYGPSMEKLREIIAILEKRTGKVLGERVMPSVIGAWKSPPAQSDDTAVLGGGASVTRTYYKGDERITARIVKDSPFMGQFVQLLANKDLISLSGMETQSIGGETAVLEGGKDDKPAKLRMAVDDRILVEITGSEKVKTTDIVAIARKIDLQLLKSLK